MHQPLYHPRVSPAPQPDDAEAIQKRIRRSWRLLSGGRRVRDADRPTLIACSGGADSCALAIALASTPTPTTLGHVVHDLRPREQGEADRDAVRELGHRLCVPVVEREIRVAAMAGNLEANAREARYGALKELGAGCGARWIVTAHHADDVLETLLMRLLRGSGPRGLGAVSPRLEFGDGLTVLRPCLDVTRDELVSVCEHAGWVWQEDATNADESRQRAALRARVSPELRRIAPEGARRASVSARLLRDAQRVVGERAADILALASHTRDDRVWTRQRLRAETGLVLGETLLLALGTRVMSPETLRDTTSAIRDETTDPRSFDLGGATLRVLANEVRLEIRRERESD